MIERQAAVCARNAPNIDDDGNTVDSGCENVYTPRTHNQKFCSPECTRIQTNANLMEKYYDTQRRKRGEVRVCLVCGFTKLSRWNPDRVCGPCTHKRETNRNIEADKIMKELNGIQEG